MLRAGAGFVVRQNLCMWGHEATQGLSILVVNYIDLVAAKEAGFFWLWLHMLI